MHENDDVIEGTELKTGNNTAKHSCFENCDDSDFIDYSELYSGGRGMIYLAKHEMWVWHCASRLAPLQNEYAGYSEDV
jgi:hypothetical protein